MRESRATTSLVGRPAELSYPSALPSARGRGSAQRSRGANDNGVSFTGGDKSAASNGKRRFHLHVLQLASLTHRYVSAGTVRRRGVPGPSRLTTLRRRVGKRFMVMVVLYGATLAADRHLGRPYLISFGISLNTSSLRRMSWHDASERICELVVTGGVGGGREVDAEVAEGGRCARERKRHNV
jgi:hypothetical protein